MTKINCFYISYCSEIMQKYHSSFKSKNKIVNTYATTTIFKYKLNYFPRTDKTYSTSIVWKGVLSPFLNHLPLLPIPLFFNIVPSPQMWTSKCEQEGRGIQITPSHPFFGNLLAKSKLSPRSGSSLEAVEPHP